MREQTLYQCPRCTSQVAGPETDEPRICPCHRIVIGDDQETRLEAVGTIEVETDGWTQLGTAVETLQKGFAVLYENEHRRRMDEDGLWQDWDTADDPVPGNIVGVEETEYGPRYEIIPETEWWHPGREIDADAPIDHVWHWEIVEVTERTRASVRIEEIRRSVRGK